MKNILLEIKALQVSIEGKPILKGLDLVVRPGEIHAIMGPNGAGKSTLAKVLAGHPAYEVTGGQILFCGQDLLEMEPEERAIAGVFMSFQYPPEIGGVTNEQFLHAAHCGIAKGRGQEVFSPEAFSSWLKGKMEEIQMRSEFSERSVNEGFSGGEKKRNEILQMAVLDPTLSILDETDSGLDIDAMRIVAQGVCRLHTEGKGLILITHYQRLLDYVKPHYVHVMLDGKIVQSGGADLALELESKGYDWLIPAEEVV